MFKVNNKDTKTTPMALFWCLCYLLTYFTPCSSVSIVNFEHVIVSWEAHLWTAASVSITHG